MSFPETSADTPKTDAEAVNADATGIVKTHLNCDPVTLARDLGHVAKNVTDAGTAKDELSKLYRPLGNKDVQCFVGN